MSKKIIALIVLTCALLIASNYLYGPSLTALITKAIVVVICSYLFAKQYNEAYGRKDDLTNLRYQILSVLGVTLVNQVPSIVYQWVRLVGNEAPILREIVTVTSNLSLLLIVILLVLIFNYKIKE